MWPPGHLFQLGSHLGSNTLSDTTGCRQVFVPTGSVGGRFELNPQILDTWDVDKGQTGLKYKVTACSVFCLLKPGQCSCVRGYDFELDATSALFNSIANTSSKYRSNCCWPGWIDFDWVRLKCQLSRGHLRSGWRSSSSSLFPPIRIKTCHLASHPDYWIHLFLIWDRPTGSGQDKLCQKRPSDPEEIWVLR